jgi:hypothetical protein
MYLFCKICSVEKCVGFVGSFFAPRFSFDRHFRLAAMICDSTESSALLVMLKNVSSFGNGRLNSSEMAAELEAHSARRHNLRLPRAMASVPTRITMAIKTPPYGSLKIPWEVIQVTIPVE